MSERATRHDGVLLARLANGEPAALAALYDAYAPMLRRFARRIAGEQDAEDVVQTVFLRVPRLAARFDALAPSARAWLFAITVRVAQERKRSSQRLAAAVRALAQIDSTKATEDPGRGSDLERCLRALPLAKRSVVLMADVEGFSCDEIAAMLAIPVGTVWTRLYYARRELRAAWHEP